jgi:hypothetical protein
MHPKNSQIVSIIQKKNSEFKKFRSHNDNYSPSAQAYTCYQLVEKSLTKMPVLLQCSLACCSTSPQNTQVSGYGFVCHAKYLLPAASNSTLKVLQPDAASDFERVYDCIVLSQALQSSPHIVIPIGEVTDEPQQITRISLGTQFLWSGMSDNFEHVTVYDQRSQLNNRGQSVFTFEQ